MFIQNSYDNIAGTCIEEVGNYLLRLRLDFEGELRRTRNNIISKLLELASCKYLLYRQNSRDKIEV